MHDTATRQEYNYYDRRTETMPRDELQAFQMRKFQTMAATLWAGNGFYRNMWQQAGISDPREIASWDDLRKLPFTKKSELVADQAANGPYGTNLTFPRKEYVRFHQTSGTTGKPLKWLDTRESWDWWAKCWCHVLAGAGVQPGDTIYFAFSFGPFVGFWAAFEGARKLGALAIPGGGLNSEARLNSILDNKPDVVLCTPSYALRLAEIAAEHGLNIKDAGVRMTIHAGEPGASIPATKARIEELWGAKCYDHCGMTEMGATGFECQAQPGGVHLIESEFIFEVINPDTGESVNHGEQGELVITNLGRVGMPNIRYRTGDRVRYNPETCACGRTFGRLQGGILGRVDDMICVRGINIFPSSLENIIRSFSEIEEFRIEVFRRKGMEELRIKVEFHPSCGETKEDELVQELFTKLRNQLALRVDVEKVAPGYLPRFELKAKRLVRVEEAV